MRSNETLKEERGRQEKGEEQKRSYKSGKGWKEKIREAETQRRAES